MHDVGEKTVNFLALLSTGYAAHEKPADESYHFNQCNHYKPKNQCGATMKASRGVTELDSTFQSFGSS